MPRTKRNFDTLRTVEPNQAKKTKFETTIINKNENRRKRSKSVPPSFCYNCPDYTLDPIEPSRVYETKLVKLHESSLYSHIQYVARYKLFPEIGWFLHSVNDKPSEEIIQLEPTNFNSEFNLTLNEVEPFTVDTNLHSSFSSLPVEFLHSHVVEWKRKWHYKGNLHRVNNPALIVRSVKRDVTIYYKHGLFHRGSDNENDTEYDQPSHSIFIKSYGLSCVNFSYFQNGVLHRLEGPSVVSGFIYQNEKYKMEESNSFCLFGKSYSNLDEFENEVFKIKQAKTFLLSVVHNEMKDKLPYDLLCKIVSFC